MPGEGHRVARAFGVVLAALPLGFGALRALTTGSDFRYLITAAAVVVVGGGVFRLTAEGLRPRGRRLIVALAISSLAGGGAAFAQGASSVGAVVTVVAGFALVVTLGGALGAFGGRANG